ncbi:hypothetical protein GGR58DRAFT_81098 [Xylaria digitata]|nr:hypothetical protein GGR58DRAFT_81098 [Xylaria digitata]
MPLTFKYPANLLIFTTYHVHLCSVHTYVVHYSLSFLVFLFSFSCLLLLPLVLSPPFLSSSRFVFGRSHRTGCYLILLRSILHLFLRPAVSLSSPRLLCLLLV